MSASSCLKQMSAPGYHEGDLRREGRYYRVLKKNALSKRYPKDDDAEPSGGRRLATPFFKDAERQGGFSVNCALCLPEPACSHRLLMPTSPQARYVMRIDLNRVRDLAGLGARLVAIYRPEALPDGTMNVCHYEFIAEDEGIGPVSMILRDIFNMLEGELRLIAPASAETPAAKALLQRNEDVFFVVFDSKRECCGLAHCDGAQVSSNVEVVRADDAHGIASPGSQASTNLPGETPGDPSRDRSDCM